MRTIAQVLAKGIQSIPDLQESLALAAQLEFSTIPPYLCAEWSIKPDADPGQVARMIHGIVVQEMLHMGLALNMLAAIGGKPSIAQAGFVPSYPTDGLPGNVHPHLKVDLLPFGNEALDTFLQIEYPEKGPIALDAAQFFPTIGDFYDAISEAFQRLQPPIGSAPQVETSLISDTLFKIASVSDALRAIDEIKEQGEGTTESPFESTFDATTPAHYYTFKQIRQQHQLKKGTDGVWRFDGPEIKPPGVNLFTPATDAHASDEFNVVFSDLLRLMEQSWSTGPATIDDAVNQMLMLQDSGMALITKGIRPEFRWTDGTKLPQRSQLMLARKQTLMKSKNGNYIQALRIVTAQGSKAESRTRAAARMLPAALAPGFPATPAHDLIFHGGRTIPNLSFFNFFVGGQAAWQQSDVDNINSALSAAMSDAHLNNVMQQYFHGPITSQQLGSAVLAGSPPAVVSQGDAEDLLTRLFLAGKLDATDLENTVFNFMLPSKTILNDNAGTTSAQMAAQFESDKKPHRAIPAPDEVDSTGGLGGYHGSIVVNNQTLYYAIGVYSEVLAGGKPNGIPAFPDPWKNVVATFYHELNEARTDADVEQANRTNDEKLVGWTSRKGEECGDFPVFEAKPLSKVFQEVPLANGNGTVPVQFQYSNAVHGPEGPIAMPH